jgi:lipopolysaccharide transport system permease protein
MTSRISARGMLGALWRYRGFVVASVSREFQLRYRGSTLGFVWNLIGPLGTVIIFTVVFAQVMRARLPGVDDIYGYGIYLCAGVLAWGLFAEIVQRGLGMFIEHGNLLKKSSFPRSSLPLIVVLTALVNFAVAFGVFLAFLALSGRFPGWIAIAAIPVIAVLVAFAAGLGVLFGTMNVFFRDIGQAITILLQFWFWLTPIVYPVTALPEFLREWLVLNPVAPIVGGLQRIFSEGRMPEWGSFASPLAVAIVALFLGAVTFRANATDIVDEL